MKHDLKDDQAVGAIEDALIEDNIQDTKAVMG